ncbi:MAG: hypothetical protein LLG06_13425 [Desulfobacteraceae bacterium]|nr:hypothetical protein [Desulfobacteraceae bacterium]
MSYDKTQFRALIDEVTEEIGLRSDAATEILLGTAAQESAFGKYLHQTGQGPAHGAFQMEQGTFDWLKEKYREKFPRISGFTFDQLRYDLRAAIIMARLKYYSISHPFPAAVDLPAMAAYYKRYYNTPMGAATEQQFIESYKRFVA